MPLKPHELAAGIRLALDLASQNKLEGAEAIASGLSLIDPNNAFIHLIVGSLLQQLGKDDEAILSYSEAIRLFPKDLNSLANRGEIYLKHGKLELAVTDLKAAVELDSKLESGPANRAQFLLFATHQAIQNINQHVS